MPPVYRTFSDGLSILSHFNFRKDMSHLVLLRLQVEAVVLLRIDLDRHALMDLKSEAGKHASRTDGSDGQLEIEFCM